MLKRLIYTSFIVAILLAPGSASSQAPRPPDDSMRELSLLLRKLDRTARVLYITAHPDDEDNGLIARMVHGEGIEVMLLSLTRGEGGQNEIGPELFHALGVLRSRELQAMSAYLGNQQRFSHAYDFGYSFSVRETFDKWNRVSVLKSVVKAIRDFRPDVILTLPPGGPGGGQHHQASAQIAIEAFDAAAEVRWQHLGAPHVTSRLFRHIWGDEDPANLCIMDVGGYDAVLGATYEEIGLRSRESHKCQGMARISEPLTSDTSRWEWVKSSDPADPPRPATHFLEGFPEPLIAGGDHPPYFGQSWRDKVARVRRDFTIENPAKTLAGLDSLVMYMRDLKSTVIPNAFRFSALKERVERARFLAFGFQIEARTDRRFVAAGDTLRVSVTMVNTTAGDVDCRLLADGPRAPDPRRATRATRTAAEHTLRPGERRSIDYRFPIARNARPTIPRSAPEHPSEQERYISAVYLDPHWSDFTVSGNLYTRRNPGDTDRVYFNVGPEPVHCQEVSSTFPATFYSDPQIVPDPSVRAVHAALPAPRPAASAVTVDVDLLVSSLKPGPLTVALNAPDGWAVEPETQNVDTKAGAGEQPVRFRVTVPPGAEDAVELRARAWYGSDVTTTSRQGYQVIEYPHIRPGALLHDANLRIVPFDCTAPGDLRVGYVDGPGDQVVEALQALGIQPVRMTSQDLLEEPLDDFDVIVTGVRAYKIRDDLKAAHGRLMEWVDGGGTMIVQYNKFEFNDGRTDSSPYVPWPGTLSGRRRVTVEESPVVVHHPDHRLFHHPNTIGAADWEGWVQERGTYFLDHTDERYLDLVTMEDPWEFNAGPKGGALLYTDVGRGRWVYCSVALFRQFPAAVPGAYRLLANLIGLAEPAAP